VFSHQPTQILSALQQNAKAETQRPNKNTNNNFKNRSATHSKRLLALVVRGRHSFPFFPLCPNATKKPEQTSKTISQKQIHPNQPFFQEHQRSTNQVFLWSCGTCDFYICISINSIHFRKTFNKFSELQIKPHSLPVATLRRSDVSDVQHNEEQTKSENTKDRIFVYINSVRKKTLKSYTF
jgi:hypothetical protein